VIKPTVSRFESDRHEFAIGSADYTSVVLLPKLLAHCHQVAPNLNFRMIEFTKDKVGDLLEHGMIDFGWAFSPNRPGKRFVFPSFKSISLALPVNIIRRSPKAPSQWKRSLTFPMHCTPCDVKLSDKDEASHWLRDVLQELCRKLQNLLKKWMLRGLSPHSIHFLSRFCVRKNLRELCTKRTTLAKLPTTRGHCKDHLRGSRFRRREGKA
jgi:hypothetical protein